MNTSTTNTATGTGTTITLKNATFDNVETFQAAARRVGKSLETAKNVTSDIVGALFRLSAGMTSADAAAKVNALYQAVYKDTAKANAGGASSYRAIIGVFKDMAAAGLNIALPVYESVNAAKKAYRAHVDNLPVNLEAAAAAAAESEAEEAAAAAAIGAATIELDTLRAIAQKLRDVLGMPDANLADLLSSVNALEIAA